MAGLIDVADQAPPESSPGASASSRVWPRLALAGIMLVSLFMNFYQLGLNGFGNLYYASAIRSMIDNWHNFFFASYDPGGFVTVDKPPLGFWLQAICAKLFGFTPFSVYLPQALAGVLAVLLLYWLVQRHFGKIAGLLAALALALSPISVVTNRNNTIDSTLALVLLLGAWAVLRAAETGKLRWLLLCAALVGIGFNIKMAEAYLVLPAFGLLYLVAAPKKLWTRIGHLALALLLLLAISLPWLVAVDMTPAALRPYVGSTQNNSEISLAFGYNGLNRLIGGFGRDGLFGSRDNQPRTGGSTQQPSRDAGRNQTPQNGNDNQRAAQAGSNRGFPANGGAFGGFMNTGAAGPFRLFGQSLGGQIAWLLPFALLGMLALAWQRRPRFPLDRQQHSLLLWGMWLLTMGVFFSVASFFHQYYLTEMAPAVCALFGIGAVVMWRDYRLPGWRGWLLPLALLLTMGAQIYILSSYPTWAKWLDPLMAVPGVMAVIALVIVRLLPRINSALDGMRSVLPALCIGILVLLIAPAVWAAIPVLNGYESQMPMAGPISTGRGFPGGGRFGNASAPPELVRYLESHQGNAKYLVATTSSMSADSIILATNRPVMAMGGFSGSDPILTVNQLAQLVKNGTVRYFLFSANGPGGFPSQFLDRIPEQDRAAIERAAGDFGGFNQQASITNWVKSHCTAVPGSQWQSSTASSSSTGRVGFGGSSQLYDCAAAH